VKRVEDGYTIAEEIEERAALQLRRQAAVRESMRQARRERIAAGKADPFDCSDEYDLVCPHCGVYEEGSQLPLYMVTDGAVREKNFERKCWSCGSTFGVAVRCQFVFTSFKVE